MQLQTELDKQIAEFFSYNKATTQLFLNLAFLMQRDMAGGLTTYDIMAREDIAQKLKKNLSQHDDRHVVNSLIEAIGNSEYSELASIIDSQSVRYIAEQHYSSLCEILKNYLPDDIGMLVKIPIEDSTNLDELISFAKNEHPRHAIGMDIDIINPWGVILNPPSLEKYPNHILIAFPISSEENRNIYYLKGLAMAKVLLTEPVEEHEEVAQITPERTASTVGSLNILKGVLSVSSRIFGFKKTKPNSRPVLVSNLKEGGETKSVSENSSLTFHESSESDEGVLLDSTSESEAKEAVGESHLQDSHHLTAGFFDTNHGFFLSIRKRIVEAD